MRFKKLIKRLKSSAIPLLAVLIDPDKYEPKLIHLANKCKVSCFLVGGSRLEKGDVHTTVKKIKKISRIPVLLFPGDETQLSAEADGLLLLSLLSGRNPDYLIEKHIQAAPRIKKLNLQILPTAYLLVDGGKASTTQLVTSTSPLDPKKASYIVHTAMAAEQLGFKAVYLEAGSGAEKNIQAPLVKKIRKEVGIPLIVGGGIDSAAKVKSLLKSGVNMIVVGNALEKNVYLLTEISACF